MFRFQLLACGFAAAVLLLDATAVKAQLSRTLVKVKDVSPVYPDLARQARVEGTVTLEIVVGTDGRVSSARVVRSVPLLDKAALDAVRQWRYDASGVSAPVTMTVDVPFYLTDGSGAAPARPRPAPPGSAAPSRPPDPDAPAAPPAAAPHAQSGPETLSEEQTLHGLPGVSVQVSTDGPVNIPARPFDSVAERVLKQAGIPLLPEDSYPELLIQVDGSCCLTLTTGFFNNDFTSWVIRVSLRQLVAVPGSSTKNVIATTWQQVKYGVSGKAAMKAMPDYVRELVGEFAKSFDVANPGRQKDTGK